jgi:BolA protein
MSVQERITGKLTDEFAPAFLEVINESDGHNVPAGSESHFKVVVVSDRFSTLARVRRHQAVYSVLTESLQNGVHALAIHTYTPEEWLARQGAPISPNCMGGSKG